MKKSSSLFLTFSKSYEIFRFWIIDFSFVIGSGKLNRKKVQELEKLILRLTLTIRKSTVLNLNFRAKDVNK